MVTFPCGHGAENGQKRKHLARQFLPRGAIERGQKIVHFSLEIWGKLVSGRTPLGDAAFGAGKVACPGYPLLDEFRFIVQSKPILVMNIFPIPEHGPSETFVSVLLINTQFVTGIPATDQVGQLLVFRYRSHQPYKLGRNFMTGLSQHHISVLT